MSVRGPFEIVAVDALATHPLRLTVLRTGTSSRDPVYPGDDDPSTRHLAVVVDGVPVAVSTWIVAPFPERPDAVGLHLRGMATDPARRGDGLGSALLAAGRGRAAEIGADLIWARARVTALTFYVAHGFEVVGDEFIDETSGLPHQLVVATP